MAGEEKKESTPSAPTSRMKGIPKGNGVGGEHKWVVDKYARMEIWVGLYNKVRCTPTEYGLTNNMITPQIVSAVKFWLSHKIPDGIDMTYVKIEDCINNPEKFPPCSFEESYLYNQMDLGELFDSEEAEQIRKMGYDPKHLTQDDLKKNAKLAELHNQIKKRRKLFVEELDEYAAESYEVKKKLGGDGHLTNDEMDELLTEKISSVAGNFSKYNKATKTREGEVGDDWQAVLNGIQAVTDAKKAHKKSRRFAFAHMLATVVGAAATVASVGLIVASGGLALTGVFGGASAALGAGGSIAVGVAGGVGGFIMTKTALGRFITRHFERRKNKEKYKELLNGMKKFKNKDGKEIDLQQAIRDWVLHKSITDYYKKYDPFNPKKQGMEFFQALIKANTKFLNKEFNEKMRTGHMRIRLDPKFGKEELANAFDEELKDVAGKYSGENGARGHAAKVKQWMAEKNVVGIVTNNPIPLELHDKIEKQTKAAAANPDNTKRLKGAKELWKQLVSKETDYNNAHLEDQFVMDKNRLKELIRDAYVKTAFSEPFLGKQTIDELEGLITDPTFKEVFTKTSHGEEGWLQEAKSIAALVRSAYKSGIVNGNVGVSLKDELATTETGMAEVFKKLAGAGGKTISEEQMELGAEIAGLLSSAFSSSTKPTPVEIQEIKNKIGSLDSAAAQKYFYEKVNQISSETRRKAIERTEELANKSEQFTTFNSDFYKHVEKVEQLKITEVYPSNDFSDYFEEEIVRGDIETKDYLMSIVGNKVQQLLETEIDRDAYKSNTDSSNALENITKLTSYVQTSEYLNGDQKEEFLRSDKVKTAIKRVIDSKVKRILQDFTEYDANEFNRIAVNTFSEGGLKEFFDTPDSEIAQMKQKVDYMRNIANYIGISKQGLDFSKDDKFAFSNLYFKDAAGNDIERVPGDDLNVELNDIRGLFESSSISYDETNDATNDTFLNNVDAEIIKINSMTSERDKLAAMMILQKRFFAKYQECVNQLVSAGTGKSVPAFQLMANKVKAKWEPRGITISNQINTYATNAGASVSISTIASKMSIPNIETARTVGSQMEL
ncbi:MAG: hypothetical protein IJ538_03875 [Clostridia bacterium]|nr:hypothetical protein [Clostridia bacterium]